MKTLSIMTDRLILRPQTLADYDVWFSVYSDPEIFKVVNAPGFTAEEAWNRLLRNVGHWASFGYGIFSVFSKEEGQFLGETGLAHFRRGVDPDFDQHVEASWVIKRSAQGQGIATEAARAAHQWFVEVYKPSQTVCLISKNNAASIRVANHIGYEITQACLYKGAECLKLACSWPRPTG